MTKAASIVAALAVLLAAISKAMSGDWTAISGTEIMLAVATLAAAFGFQRPSK